MNKIQKIWTAQRTGKRITAFVLLAALLLSMLFPVQIGDSRKAKAATIGSVAVEGIGEVKVLYSGNSYKVGLNENHDLVIEGQYYYNSAATLSYHTTKLAFTTAETGYNPGGALPCVELSVSHRSMDAGVVDGDRVSDVYTVSSSEIERMLTTLYGDTAFTETHKVYMSEIFCIKTRSSGSSNWNVDYSKEYKSLDAIRNQSPAAWSVETYNNFRFYYDMELIFEPPYNITYNTNPANEAGGYVSSYKEKVYEGETVRIGATPEDGWKFDKWTVDFGGAGLESASSPSTTFTMPGNDVELTAHFSKKPTPTPEPTLPPGVTPTPTPKPTATPAPTSTPTPIPKSSTIRNYGTHYFTTTEGYTMENVVSNAKYYQVSETTATASTLNNGITKRTLSYAKGTDSDGNTWYFYPDGNNATYVHPCTYKGYDVDTAEVKNITELTFPEKISYNGTSYTVTEIGGGTAKYKNPSEEVNGPNSSVANTDADGNLVSTQDTTKMSAYGKVSGGYYYFFRHWTQIGNERRVSVDLGYVYGVAGNGRVETSGSNVVNNAYGSEPNKTIVTTERSYSASYYVYNTTLKEVTIPATVTKVDEYAFLYCQALTKINGGTGLVEIGDEGFAAAEEITSRLSGESNKNGTNSKNYYYYNESSSKTSKTAKMQAWENQSKLSSNLTMPTFSALKTIGEYAFARHTNLMKKITFGSAIAKIGKCAFLNCSLTDITLRNMTTDIFWNPQTLGTQANGRDGKNLTVIHTEPESTAVKYGYEYLNYYEIDAGYPVAFYNNATAGRTLTRPQSGGTLETITTVGGEASPYQTRSNFTLRDIRFVDAVWVNSYMWTESSYSETSGGTGGPSSSGSSNGQSLAGGFYLLDTEGNLWGVGGTWSDTIKADAKVKQMTFGERVFVELGCGDSFAYAKDEFGAIWVIGMVGSTVVSSGNGGSSSPSGSTSYRGSSSGFSGKTYNSWTKVTSDGVKKMHVLGTTFTYIDAQEYPCTATAGRVSSEKAYDVYPAKRGSLSSYVSYTNGIGGSSQTYYYYEVGGWYALSKENPLLADGVPVVELVSKTSTSDSGIRGLGHTPGVNLNETYIAKDANGNYWNVSANKSYTMSKYVNNASYHTQTGEYLGGEHVDIKEEYGPCTFTITGEADGGTSLGSTLRMEEDGTLTASKTYYGVKTIYSVENGVQYNKNVPSGTVTSTVTIPINGAVKSIVYGSTSRSEGGATTDGYGRPASSSSTSNSTYHLVLTKDGSLYSVKTNTSKGGFSSDYEMASYCSEITYTELKRISIPNGKKAKDIADSDKTFYRYTYSTSGSYSTSDSKYNYIYYVLDEDGNLWGYDQGGMELLLEGTYDEIVKVVGSSSYVYGEQQESIVLRRGNMYYTVFAETVGDTSLSYYNTYTWNFTETEPTVNVFGNAKLDAEPFFCGNYLIYGRTIINPITGEMVFTAPGYDYMVQMPGQIFTKKVTETYIIQTMVQENPPYGNWVQATYPDPNRPAITRNYIISRWMNMPTAASNTLYYRTGTMVPTYAPTNFYAEWEQVTVAVTYDANGGTGYTEPTCAGVGANITISRNYFKKKDYVFAEWNTEADGSGTSYQPGDRVSYDTAGVYVLYAQWQKNEVEVALDGRGATKQEQTSVVVVFGDEIPEVIPPEKTGYDFDGYYTEVRGNGKKYYDSTGKGVSKWEEEDINILFAYWIQKPVEWPEKEEITLPEVLPGEQMVVRVELENATVQLYADDHNQETGAETDVPPYFVSDKMDNGKIVEKGAIPSTESVALRAKTGNFILSCTLERKSGIEHVRTRITVPYRTQFEDLENETLKISEIMYETVEVIIPKAWSYWILAEGGIYFPEKVVAKNAALETGQVEAPVDWNTKNAVNKPTYQLQVYGEKEQHVIWNRYDADGAPVQDITLTDVQYIISEIPGRAPDVEKYLSAFGQKAALADTTQFMVKSDSISVAGITLLSDEISINGIGAEPVKTAPEAIKDTITETVFEQAYQSEIPIRRTGKNGRYETTAEILYRAVKLNVGDTDEVYCRTVKTNEINVHTPVVCLAEISANHEDMYQCATVPEGSTVLVLDEEGVHSDFWLEVSNTGYHSGKKGYGEGCYTEYLAEKDGKAQNEVCFPVDVWIDTGNDFGKENDTYLEAGNWYLLGCEKQRFYIPFWIEEGSYEILFRSVAVNAEGKLEATEKQRNEREQNYVAVDSKSVFLTGRLYDFSVYEVEGNTVWEEVESTESVYTVGPKAPEYQLWKTLPLRKGCHPYYQNLGGLPMGGTIRFRMKSIGRSFSEDALLTIEPVMYVVNGGEYHAVDVYYEEETDQGVFFRCWDAEKQKICITEKKDLTVASIQEWSGEFSVPKQLYVAEKGANVAEYQAKYGLTFNEEFWLKDELLILRFAMTLKNTAGDVLYYGMVPEGIVNVIWRIEAGETVREDRAQNYFEIHGGEVAVIYPGDTTEKGYKISGIY